MRVEEREGGGVGLDWKRGEGWDWKRGEGEDGDIIETAEA